MANSDERQRTMSSLLNPAPEPRQMRSFKKKYRHCKSAPVDFVHPAKIAGKDTPKSFFADFHPSFLQVALVLAAYLGLGTLCFSFFKNHMKGDKTNGTLDAIYFCIVTMTTVGYGDLVPNTVATKLFACAFVFAGMALVGLVLSKAADYLVEKQETILVEALNLKEDDGQIDVPEKVKTTKVKYKLLMTTASLLVLIIVGTVFLSRVEGFDFVDSFYCVVCTITTLGYGDKSFSTVAGRIFAVFWIVASTVCLAQVFLCIAELNTERRRRKLVQLVLKREITRTDLEAADLDGDRLVSAAEFIVYKLKEMGQLSQEDIALIMEEFEILDVDHNGTLSPSDITEAQYTQAET